MRLAWLGLGVVLLGCEARGTEPAAASPDEAWVRPCPGELASNQAADGFVATSGSSFESCGRESYDERPACCGPRIAGYECLVAALRACKPARFAVARGTIEGDPIYSDYFVVPAEEGEGCRLMVMTDSSRDAYRDPSVAPVRTSFCSTAGLSTVDEGCPELELDGCHP